MSSETMTNEDALLIEELLLCGRRMGNALFAWKQEHEIPEEVREKMQELHAAWDRAYGDSKAARERMNDLPPAFDPIEMGC